MSERLATAATPVEPPQVVLTPAQEAALLAEGDALVSAAAGSGKTRVLVERIVRALVEERVPVTAIVAVTFTEKAAQEIRERVSGRLTQLGQHDLAAALEQAAIGTIHGLCARILRRYGARVGIDPGFQVFDSAQVAYLQQESLRETLDGADSPELVQLRLRYGDERIAGWLRAVHDAASQRVDASARFHAGADPLPRAEDDAHRLNELLDAFQAAYADRCRRAGGLDFDDLQRGALRVLADDDVRTELQYRIQRVLVDEFQDTNQLQCAVLDALGVGCTFAVGDEWQSIYRFRKADVSVFRDRAAAVASGALPMRDNFRSTAGVLDVVNHAFGSVFGERYAPVVAGREGTEAEADGAPAAHLVAVPGLAGGGRRAEAAWVAGRVASLLDDGVAPGGIALLMARQTNAEAFEEAFAERGIATVRSASSGYWGQQQVADVTALLAWARNLQDDRAALAVLAAPYVGMQWRDLLRLRRAAPTIWDALVQDADPRAGRARDIVLAVRQASSEGTLVDAVQEAVRGSGYLDMVLATRDGRRRAANMRKLLELAASAHRIGIDDVGRFLTLVEAQRMAAVEGEASIAEESATAVRLMTVHASKGLEFPYVFVVDCGNAGVRTAPELLVDRLGRASFIVADEDGTHVSIPEELEAAREQEAAEAAAEEQRLYYVALTRAREALWMTGTLRRHGDNQRATGPLAWLLDAFDVDLDEVRAAGGRLAHATLPLEAHALNEADAAVLCEARPATQSWVAQPAEGEGVATDDPLELPPLWAPAPAPPRVPAGQPAPFGAVRRQAAAEADTQERELGRAVHAALARALRAAVAGSDPRETSDFSDAVAGRLPAEQRALVEGVLDGPTFQELVRRGARAEEPYLLRLPDDTVEEGRFDAVAADEGRWWVVDYKTSVPLHAASAWELHGEQLTRYADAAFAAGAREVRLTLVPLDRPDQPHEWRLRPSEPAAATPDPEARPVADPVAGPAPHSDEPESLQLF